MRKPILCLDFDGVIHSYKSGWKGAANIPDPPVEGALEFIVTALDHFTVAIHSSRSHQWGGRRAMKRWLKRHLKAVGMKAGGYEGPGRCRVGTAWFLLRMPMSMDTWEDDVEDYVDAIIKRIRWPLFKPPATMSIDDRGHCFDGTFPSIAEIKAFQPWYRRSSC